MSFLKKRTTKSQQELKFRVAKAAIQYIDAGMSIGVGTGSTIDFFIDELVKVKSKINLIVSSSKKSTEKLENLGLKVVDLNYASKLDLYIDGADEVNKNHELVKGGGGALTQEKICRVYSNKFICIIDESKLVRQLGTFPIPVEVIPSARSYVSREIIKLGGSPAYREGVITDNGNIILDIHHLEISEPLKVEREINQIVGVVCNGIFATNPANIVLIARKDGTITEEQ